MPATVLSMSARAAGETAMMDTAGWLLLGGVVLTGGVLTQLKAEAARTRARKGLPPELPREPFTDMPGQWRAPVRAVTPAGLAVRQSRCCLSGHQTPGKAAAHAARVAARIERTGR